VSKFWYTDAGGVLSEILA